LDFHDLRHTFATRLAGDGIDAFTIAGLLGDADLRMTRGYSHALDRNKRQAVEGLVNYGRSEKDCHKFVTNEKRKAG
jgi:integrase